ncbi:uncharacterized protein LOC106164243 [Lingula anatina]|uniref:Uncharacterized protein LOC106164243 n=1 Tax=Lingula anatina TaxID=7574 RepID=A0A1S3IH54_LINAN|nr:uncharacterized protein LOC106164243 [Lingula anatina]|eukprot:XP_013397547.1 uncharacterized protein LOC106164243 [Lingula anatina]
MGCVNSKENGNAGNPNSSSSAEKDFKSMSTEQLAEELKTAVDRGEGKTAVSIICACKEMPVALNEAFKEKYQQSIPEACAHKLQDPVKFGLTLLFEETVKASAVYLKECIEHRDLESLCEMFASCDEEDVEGFSAEFTKQCEGQTLADALQNGNFGDEDTVEALRSLIEFQSSRESNECVETETVISAVESGNLFHGDKVFFKLLSNSARKHTKEVFESYLKRCQRDITVEIEKHYCDTNLSEARQNMSVIAQVIRTAPLYYAQTLQRLLPSQEVHSINRALYIIVWSHHKGILTSVMENYESTHFTQLMMDVRSQCKNAEARQLMVNILQRHKAGLLN